MKRKTFTLLAIVDVAGMGLILINSCSKSENNLQKEKSFKFVDFSPKGDVEALIKSFNDLYEEYKLGYKAGEVIPLNEALWNLEAGINYEFRSDKESLSDIENDTILIEVAVSTNGNGDLIVNSDDLMNSYEELLNFTNVQIDGNDKALLVSDVEYISSDGQTATLKMTTLAGSSGNNQCQINTDDYWRPTLQLGKCYPYEGQGIGIDADDRIRTILNCVQINAGYWAAKN